jgi:hypothetical protein
MPELRVIAVNEDGTHLVLKSDDGHKYTLPIDERLRAAVRGDRARLGQIQVEVDSQLRPRDIQARIRSGMTAEEVARLAGISVDRVRRFEGPVLAERAYMAERAQKAPVRRRPEEPGHSSGGTGPGPLLGDIVAEHLRRRGVEPEAAQWDSWRRDDGRWEIVLAFELGTRVATARWSFDPPRRVAVPDDDEARSLSSEEPDRPEPTFPFVPRIASVPDRRGTAGASGTPGSGSASGTDQRGDAARDHGTDDTDDLLALVHQTGPTRPVDAPRPPDTPGGDRSAHPGSKPSPSDMPTGRPGPKPAPSADQPAATPSVPPVPSIPPMPSRDPGGTGRPATPAAPAARGGGSSRRGAGSAFDNLLFSSSADGDSGPERMVEPHRDRLTGRTDNQAEADGVRPGRRATVPSWDEIVFGSRRDHKPER